MRVERWFVEELRRWSRQPTELPPADAARAVTARLRPRPERSRRAIPLRPVVVGAAAAAAVLVTATALLWERGTPAPAGGTPATVTLSSGTLVVIDLGEVRR